MISDLGNGPARKRHIRRHSSPLLSPVSGFQFPVSKKGRRPLQDEFTHRTDLTAQQRFDLRHPYQGNGGNGIHGKGALLAKSEELNLGLALVSLVAIPGVPLTAHDIAAWCGCTTQAIQRIERDALKKLRNALFFRDHEACAELRDAFTNERCTAKRKLTRIEA